MPILREVMGVDLGEEDRQDHGQHCDQVHLPPVTIAVKGVEDSWDITAEDPDGDSSVVQCHPAATSLLRPVAAEQVIANRAQHAHLKAEEPYGVDDVVLSGGPSCRQHCGHVVQPQGKEEDEAQQVTPDVHRFIGQDEQAFNAKL